jgi:hypothetical protein
MLNWHNATAYTDFMFERATEQLGLKKTFVWKPDEEVISSEADLLHLEDLDGWS